MSLKRRGPSNKVKDTGQASVMDKAKPVESKGLQHGKSIEHESQNIAASLKGRGLYKDVLTSEIDLDPKQPRKRNKPSLDLVKSLQKNYQDYKLFLNDESTGFNPESFHELYPDQAGMLIRFFNFSLDIDVGGLDHPINIYKVRTRFIIIQGERRFLAHVLINREFVPVIVRPDPLSTGRLESEMEHRIRQFSENFQREGLSTHDKIESAHTVYNLYINLHGHSPKVREFGKLLHVGKSTAADYLKVVSSDAAMKEVAQGSDVSIAHLLDVQTDASPKAKPVQKTVAVPKKKSVGRRAKVDLGKVEQPHVVKAILELCLGDLNEKHPDIDWADAKSVQSVWSQFMKTMIRDVS